MKTNTNPENGQPKNRAVFLLFFVTLLLCFYDVKGQNPEPQESNGLNEVMPEFPGGMDAMYTYMAKNLRYPKEALDKKVRGLVMVTFVIKENGSICNVEIASSKLESRKKDTEKAKVLCEEEAMRVIRNMPAWKPATRDGEPVEVECRIPIRFSY